MEHSPANIPESKIMDDITIHISIDNQSRALRKVN